LPEFPRGCLSSAAFASTAATARPAWATFLRIRGFLRRRFHTRLTHHGAFDLVPERGHL
jgi:hypothetical protein